MVSTRCPQPTATPACATGCFAQEAALETARRVSAPFLSSRPCRLQRKPGEDEVHVLVHADDDRGPGEDGYFDPDEAEGAGSFLRSIRPPARVS
ncbi:hypothetical protein ADK55_06740 [Streptomyces sp. WM4235]|nr:hypothetical protein ADK55_06740 [Streptomyces sp. WM4235]